MVKLDSGKEIKGKVHLSGVSCEEHQGDCLLIQPVPSIAFVTSHLDQKGNDQIFHQPSISPSGKCYTEVALFAVSDYRWKYCVVNKVALR